MSQAFEEILKHDPVPTSDHFAEKLMAKLAEQPEQTENKPGWVYFTVIILVMNLLCVGFYLSQKSTIDDSQQTATEQGLFHQTYNFHY
ncbi:hypothetical protein GC194_13590 [bacterium]|nr:hypothetical protein [bacterium]